jgi:hypothetical protein
MSTRSFLVGGLCTRVMSACALEQRLKLYFEVLSG